MCYYRVHQVAKMFSVSVSTIWRWAKAGEFPQPIKLGPRTTAWSQSSLDDFSASKD